MITIGPVVFQIYYYHNVKCRVEMFDKDIIMLQVRTHSDSAHSTCALTSWPQTQVLVFVL